MPAKSGCSGCSVSQTCFEMEKYIAGYKPEYIYLGLQVAVAFAVAMLPITINLLYRALNNENSIWMLVTVAVVVEPNMGGSLRKGVLRTLGALLGGGLGFAVVGIAEAIAPTHDQNLSQDGGKVLGPIVSFGLALCGFLVTVHKQRFKHIEHFFFVALYTMPVVVFSALREGSTSIDYEKMGWRVVNVIAGIVIASVTSVLVFPIRARWVLQRDMASMLIRLGDLTVWILSQVCAKPNPDFSFPGTSYTDKALTYSDDGVEAKLAPVMNATRKLGAQLANLSVLLEAADKEWYFFRKPRVFPTAKYRLLLQSCENLIALEMALLYWLQSTVTNLALVHASARDVRELGVRVSSACTALSHLVHAPKKPKSSKKGKASGGNASGPEVAKGQEAGVWSRLDRIPSMWRGRVEVDPVLRAAANAAAAEAAGARSASSSARELVLEMQGGVQQGQQRWQGQEQQQLGADLEAPPAVEEDNPFAELVAAQLVSEAQMRRLEAEDSSVPGAAAGKGATAPPATLPPSAPGGSAAAAAAAAAAAPECGKQGNSIGEGREGQGGELELGAVALTRLCAMADAAKQLMQTLTIARANCMGSGLAASLHRQERTAGGSLQHAAAFDTLAVVVNTGTGIARQLAAMFTALDPGRAPLLHDYIRTAVAELDEVQERLAGTQCGAMTHQQQQQQQPAAKMYELDSPK